MNGIYLYFVNKLFLAGHYWDFKPDLELPKTYIFHVKNITPSSIHCYVT